MKKIGLLGGMSAESSIEYYRRLHDGIRFRLGGLHSADLCLRSLNFAEIAALQHQDDWASLNALMIKEARQLAQMGAEAVIICSNLMHRCAPAIKDSVDVNLIEITREIARTALTKRCRRLAVLGAKPTMEADFYRTALEVEGIEETLIPDTSGREFVNSLIYEELCRGIFREESRKDLHSLFDELIDQGADGIVLGCTELPMLLLSGRTERPQMFHRNIPLFDSMDIHCQSAIRWMLDKDPATIDKKGRKR